jgi:hypothetical protein
MSCRVLLLNAIFIAAAADSRSTLNPSRATDRDIKWRPTPTEEEGDGGNYDDDDDDDDEWSKVEKSWVRDSQQLQADSNKMKREQGH